MPASLLELKKKIASVKQTGKITEAMRMVSASKLNQTENHDKEYTVYNDYVRKTISRLISSQVVDNLRENSISIDKNNVAKIDYTDVFGLGITADMIQTRKKVKTTGFLVISGDRGLVGSYNSNVIKNMMSIFEDERAQGHEVKVLAVLSALNSLRKTTLMLFTKKMAFQMCQPLMKLYQLFQLQLRCI